MSKLAEQHLSDLPKERALAALKVVNVNLTFDVEPP